MAYKLILASSSPRRQQLMQEAGFEFEVRLREVPEVYPDTLPVEQVPEYLARLKASAFNGDLQEDELLITADTIVPSTAKWWASLMTGNRLSLCFGSCLGINTPLSRGFV